MKSVYLIGILAFLLITVGSASATMSINVNVFKDEPGDPVPPNTAINAVCDGNTITVQASPTNGATLPINFDITSIYLPLSYIEGASASAPNERWTYSGNKIPSVGGGLFGSFPVVSEWQGENKIKSGGPIKITYPNIESILTANRGYSIVLKVSWNGDESNWVGGKTEIPEFSSIAFPIATIIGIMFIFGRRKNS